MKTNKKRNDLILIGSILLAAVLFYVGMQIFAGRHKGEAVAVVTVKGEVFGTYPLGEDVIVEIPVDEEQYNILHINGGKADITEASCPDKICVKHHVISAAGQTIVCLPNEVVVEIENGTEAEVDGMTR